MCVGRVRGTKETRWNKFIFLPPKKMPLSNSETHNYYYFQDAIFSASLFTVLPSPPPPPWCSERPRTPEPASKLQITILNKYFLNIFVGKLLFDRKWLPTGRGVRTWIPSPRSFRSSRPSSPNPRRQCRRAAGTAVNRVWERTVDDTNNFITLLFLWIGPVPWNKKIACEKIDIVRRICGKV